MGDFITLSCPNCGGDLRVGKNISLLTCQHCGVQHLVRREAGTTLLEAFARCPICNRNDRVEKVSAVVENQSSPVAAKLSPPRAPVEPTKPGGFGFWWLLLVYVGIYVACGPAYLALNGIQSVFGNEFFNEKIWLGLLLLIFILFISVIWSVMLLRFLLKRDKDLIKQRTEAPKYQQSISDYKKGYSEWEIAMSNWRGLYYCFRDGIIFEPKTGIVLEPEKINQFVFSRT
jgi:predicted RNA-binding Zn-ribbon protein involved in translation (DUF1610 family)